MTDRIESNRINYAIEKKYKQRWRSAMFMIHSKKENMISHLHYISGDWYIKKMAFNIVVQQYLSCLPEHIIVDHLLSRMGWRSHAKYQFLLLERYKQLRE